MESMKVQPLPEVGTARFHCPTNEWAVMPIEAKREAWDTLLLNAMRGAISDHPDCLFGFDMRELHPDAKDLVNPDGEPEIIGEVHVKIYQPL